MKKLSMVGLVFLLSLATFTACSREPVRVCAVIFEDGFGQTRIYGNSDGEVTRIRQILGDNNGSRVGTQTLSEFNGYLVDEVIVLFEEMGKACWYYEDAPMQVITPA